MSSYFRLLIAVVPVCLTLAACSGHKQVFLQDAGNGFCRQTSSGLLWHWEKRTVFSSYEEARAYVQGLRAGGYADWRLPTSREAYILSELLLMAPEECTITTKRGYWVSDQRGKNKAGYWEDYPACGGVDFHWINRKNGRLLAVRP